MHPLTLLTLLAYASTAALHLAYVARLAWRREDDTADDDARDGLGRPGLMATHRNGGTRTGAGGGPEAGASIGPRAGAGGDAAFGDTAGRSRFGGDANRWARGSLFVALALHLVDMTARGLRGLHPATDAAEAISFLVLLLVSAYGLAIAVKASLTVLGAVVTPVSLALLGTARLSRLSGAASQGAPLGLLGRTHISFATAGVAAFGLAAAAAAFYLFQQRLLKQNRVTPLARRSASLQTLDRLSQRAVGIGFPIFTVAMVTGAWWMERIPLPNQGPWVLRPEHIAATLAWFTYAGLLGARAIFGWRGRRAAWLTIAGFGTTVIVLGGYLARAHGG